jgi:DNA helicase-2/ATP-dependent DNA helicase PcrA
MHKAKGKEFDAVIIVDGPSPRDKLLLQGDSAGAGYAKSRRLLHMAITRARSFATILTPTWEPCGLLPHA